MRQQRVFVSTLVASAIVMGTLVYIGHPGWGLAAGISGILVHCRLSRGGKDDGELADASYFFGFLLTLVFLTIGLLKLGASPRSAPLGPTPGGTSASSLGVLAFLKDLALGLVLTIVGLTVRQARTLSATTAGEATGDTSSQAELVEKLETLIELWRPRPEGRTIQELQESGSITQNAAELVQRRLMVASKRMLSVVRRLDDATSSIIQELTRSASGLGDSLSQMTQRVEAEVVNAGKALGDSVTRLTKTVEAEVSEILEVVEQQRVASTNALAAAQAESERSRRDAEIKLREHLESWRVALEQAKGVLDEAHRNLDSEYRRGVEAYASSGVAFAELAERTTSYISAMPNPAERLAGLWSSVSELEATLRDAIVGSASELEVLRERSEHLTKELSRLGEGVGAAANTIDFDGGRLTGALQRELKQMNSIVEEYLLLLEATTNSIRTA
jgi:hypothetical protein